MHFRQLDLNLLVALDALLTERNITRAGKRVFLTQSAMSGALARLREYFSDELLVQVGRKMVPTPLGESLAAPVRSILMQVQETLQSRPTFDPASSTRRFILMMSDYVSSVLLTDVLKHISGKTPNLQFDLVSNDVDAPADVIDHGDVDMLIMPQQFLAKDHPSEPLFRDDYVCIVSADHPEIGDRLSTEQYLSLGHVVARFNRGRNPAVDEWVVGRLGLERRIEVVTTTFSAIPQYVAGTRRLATIQRRLAEQFARYLPLKIVPAPIELPSLEETMQWHTQFAADPAIAWLRGEMRAAAARITRERAATELSSRGPRRIRVS